MDDRTIKEIGRLGKEIDTKRKERDRLADKVGEIDVQIATLQNHREQIESDRADLQRDITALTSDLGNLYTGQGKTWRS